MSELLDSAQNERLIRTDWGTVSMLLDCPWCIGSHYYDESPAGRDRFFCRSPLEIEGEQVPVFDLDSLCRSLFAVKSPVFFPAVVFASTAGLSSEDHAQLADHLRAFDLVYNPNLVAFRLSGETGLFVLPRSRRKSVSGAVGAVLCKSGITGVCCDTEGIEWYVDPFALLMKAISPDGDA